MPKLNEMHIQKRLTTGFTFTTAITSIGAIVGIIALLFISNRYTSLYRIMVSPRAILEKP